MDLRISFLRMKLFLEKFTIEVFHRRYFRVNVRTFPDYLFCRTPLCYCSWGRIEKVKEPDSFAYIFFEILYQRCSLRKLFLEISKNLQENAGLKPATLLRKRLWLRCFLVNFAKFLRTPFSQNNSGWLLLWLLKEALYWISFQSRIYQRA